MGASDRQGTTDEKKKKKSAADAPAPGTDAPKTRLLKPVSKGIKDASFQDSERGWDGKYHNVIGTSTRTIVFGSQFVLTDDHIDDILVLARQVREKITQFIFCYGDVSYDAKALTNEAVVRLAKGLPKLRVFYLPGANEVGDQGLLGFLENCPDLRSVEITFTSNASSGGTRISGKVFEQWQQHPEWAPGLKQLIMFGDPENREFMKPLRELGKQREGLVITFLVRQEEKKYRDWQLAEYPKAHYQKGRKHDSFNTKKIPKGIKYRT
ncbi:hypothetical protein FSARC_8107 [Fusarium sarcochroum]|uniref:Uncharacterized protein n=1 Tax=Fusarium sarcochroum TaxID=1208366 RepID=A0A8H4TTL7_9HYPO|nr:hypothetical protein FSARC_8107 [Fusarium sarcochroum]